MAAKSERNGPTFDDSRPDRLRAAIVDTRFVDADWVTSTGSTNDDLARAAQQGAPESVLVTDVQTAGRGRRNRTWSAPINSGVLMSLLLRDDRHWAPFWVVGAVALAAAEAASAQIEATVRLKWPNDLLIGEAKVAGVLAQGVGGACVVGLGINTTWPAVRPPDVPPHATALSEHTTNDVDREALAAAIAIGTDRWLSAPVDHVRAEWKRRCETIGRSVVVERESGDLRGVAVGVGSDGALVVSTEGGVTEHVVVGDVVHLKRGPAGDRAVP